MNLENLIKERKSVRSYKDTKIPKEILYKILELGSKAPSSNNLQPWRFLVIQDEETKKNLRKISYNQEQIETSSAVIAVLGDTEMYKKTEEIYEAMYEKGSMTKERAEYTIKSFNEIFPKMKTEDLKSTALFDAGLISMQIMLIAKDMGYDTCTLGGFDKVEFSKMFDLPQNHFPIALIVIGEAKEPGYETSRLSVDTIAKFI